MKVNFRKRFLKELSRIPSEMRSKMESFVFKELPRADSIFELGAVEQMKGYPSYFKVRFGLYRIGLKMEKGKVILERALHRKDIYRHFP